MLVFNCTKAAAEFFTCKRQGVKYSPIKPSPEGTLADSLAAQNQLVEVIEKNDYEQAKPWHWLVHAIKVKRKNVLIVMDCQSRFSLILTGLKKGDELGFLNLFEQQLTTQVKLTIPLFYDDLAAINESLDEYNAEYAQCTFYQRGDRSIQAHINDVAWHVELEVQKTGEVPIDETAIEFEIFANQLLRKSKGTDDYFEPREEFTQMWLQQFAHLKPNQTARLIKTFIENVRAKNRERFDVLHKTSDDDVNVRKRSLIEIEQELKSYNVIEFSDFVNRKK